MKNERFDFIIITVIIGIASSNYGLLAGIITRLLFFCLPACLPALSASAFPAPFMSMLSTDVFFSFIYYSSYSPTPLIIISLAAVRLQQHKY